ncbi:MAG: Peptidase M23 [Candidatus Moranbacteria bacterium GW2011_GWE1_35_17]|nr:MAG: Peptidase M23 [Candidatus Moranbacteria bacterium GW2011_GWE1_35_17]KKP80937.1 MAG: Peptidase M23 [Candidatus Moranbacteria bacterium GW2011_GWF1_35_5]
MKKTMKKTTIYISGLFLMIVFCNINIESARGDECSALGTSTEREQCKCNQKENAEEAKICLEKISNNLDEKAATYEKILLLKQKQKSLLGTQINSLNTEIVDIKTQIKENSSRIEGLNKKNDELQAEIIRNDFLIQGQRKILANVIRSCQENDDNIITKIVFNIENFSVVAKTGDYFDQTSDKIMEITDSLKHFQNEIKNSQNEISKNKEELAKVSMSLEEENTKLLSAKAQKNSLLVQTQGDEATYQAKLAKIEKQKQELLGDIDDLYNANFAEISALASGLEKPSSGLAATGWYYSQKDSRWGNETIGNSKSKMKDLGCAVTSVAMVFTCHDERINPKQLSDKPIFSWDLINWPRSWNGLTLSSSTAHAGVSWGTIDKEIKEDNPVIVFINARNGAGHYVVIHHKADNGKYVVHDPYWGANIYLDSSVELLSKLYKVSIGKNAINQMIVYK